MNELEVNRLFVQAQEFCKVGLNREALELVFKSAFTAGKQIVLDEVKKHNFHYLVNDVGYHAWLLGRQAREDNPDCRASECPFNPPGVPEKAE